MSHTQADHQDNEMEISIRRERPGDDAGLRRLAARDSAGVPFAPVLIASVDGEIRAAISLADTSMAVADPFHPTAHLLNLLRIEAGSRALVDNRPAAGWSLRATRRRFALRDDSSRSVPAGR